MMELCEQDNIGIRFSIDEVRAAARDETLAADLAERFEEAEADARS